MIIPFPPPGQSGLGGIPPPSTQYITPYCLHTSVQSSKNMASAKSKVAAAQGAAATGTLCFNFVEKPHFTPFKDAEKTFSKVVIEANRFGDIRVRPYSLNGAPTRELHFLDFDLMAKAKVGQTLDLATLSYKETTAEDKLTHQPLYAFSGSLVAASKSKK